jgi:LmbE family N-acetylglucosaminyl deacetylase
MGAFDERQDCCTRAPWTRRAVLLTLAGLAVPASAVATAPSAAASAAPSAVAAVPPAAGPRRTTVVYAPHPDDETLRLAAVVTAARQRGDRLVLVAVTDGGASSLGPARGMSAAQVAGVRTAEQAAAWAALAGPDAPVVRLRWADGAVRAAALPGVARALDARYGPDAHHVAACHAGDGNRDHVAVAVGLAAAGLGSLRCALAAPDIATGAGELVPQADPGAAQRADEAYAPFGHASVPGEFAALRDAGYASRVTP